MQAAAASGHHCIAIDLPGHGGTSCGSSEVSSDAGGVACVSVHSTRSIISHASQLASHIAILACRVVHGSVQEANFWRAVGSA